MKRKATLFIAAAATAAIGLLAASCAGWDALSPAGKKIESDD
jgi:hypothetical protein